ncbi:MAG: hypothetical protein ACPGRE_08460 [Flavobacteriaceae bacterium]
MKYNEFLKAFDPEKQDLMILMKDFFDRSSSFKIVHEYKGAIKHATITALNTKYERYFPMNSVPFSYIVNSDSLNFYLRINHQHLVTPEIRAAFPKNNTKAKSSKNEYSLTLNNKEEALEFLEMLFANKLGVHPNFINAFKD